jgi:hypothetical protein
LDNQEEWTRVSRHLQKPQALAATLEEICHWLRNGAPGRALSVAEAALQGQSAIEVAKATIRQELLTNTPCAEKMFSEIAAVLIMSEKERSYGSASAAASPLSVSDRDVLAARIINALFHTTL